MNNHLLLLTFLFFMVTFFTVNAQTTILDFESPATTADFEFFGSSIAPGPMNLAVANPFPGGINTSATVAEFTKPAGSEVWAGGFSDPQTVIDFSNDNAICLKVWLDQPTNLLLKVEGGLNGAPDWELNQQINDAQTWVDVCYNVEGQAAEGQMYTRLTLFFSFGTSLSAEEIYYFDDVVVTTAAPELFDVTFSVDMSNYTAAFDSLFVSGTFNGFSPNSNPLDDSDGDGIWTHTIVDMAPGSYEYLFQLDQFGVSENFSDKFYDCTNTTFGAGGEVFINRTLNVSSTGSLPTICWNSCYECGEAGTLTFQLGEGNTTPSPEGFFVAGGGNFSVPGVFSMINNGSDIHIARFEKPMGFSSFYTYTNGACGDFSCKENIQGQDCADPANFDDRFLAPMSGDTFVRDCFESCDIDLADGSNCLAALPIKLLSFTGRNINGINELAWKTATEENSDFFEIQKSTDGLNFARIGAVDAAGESLLTLSYTFEDATPALGNNYYRLRMVDLDGTFEYSNIVQIATRIEGDIAVYPVPVHDALYLIYDSDNTGTIQIQVVNTIGQTLHTRTENTTQGFNTFELDINQLSTGTYLIQVRNDKGLNKVKRFVKN